MSTDTDKKLLTKDDIISADDFEIRIVEVPEWKGTVRLKSLSGKEYESYVSTVQQRSKNEKVDVKNLRALLLSMCLVDFDNNPTFTANDLEALTSKNTKVLDMLFQIVQEMNAMEKDVEEELRKN